MKSVFNSSLGSVLMGFTYLKATKWIAIFLFIFAGNFMKISIFLGIDFLFGPIISFLLLRYVGFTAGLLSAVWNGIYTYFLWGHPFGIVLMIGEYLFIAYFYIKTKRYLIIYDLSYWIFVGVPFIFLFYATLLNASVLDISIIALKDTINGTVNAIIATLCIFIIQFWSKENRKQMKLQDLLNNMILAIFVIPSLLLFTYQMKKDWENTEQMMLVHTKRTEESISKWLHVAFEDKVEQLEKQTTLLLLNDYTFDDQLSWFQSMRVSIPELEQIVIKDFVRQQAAQFPITSNNLNKELRPYTKKEKIAVHFIKGERQKIKLTIPIFYQHPERKMYLGELEATLLFDDPANYIERMMENQPDIHVNLFDEDWNAYFSLESKRDTYLLNYLKIRSNFLFHKEMPVLWNTTNQNMNFLSLDHASYIYVKPFPSMNLSILVETPFEPYKRDILRKYVIQMGTVLIFIMMAIIVSWLISRWTLRPIHQLIQLTSNLPEKILKQQKIIWPKSPIEDVVRLVQNYEKMERELAASFSELMNQQEQLEFLANYDPLTKLYNRYALKKMFNELMAERMKDGTLIAVMYIDLDRFKLINDSLGHGIGDLVLKQIADRIKSTCPQDAVIARQGGDEFVIILHKFTNLDPVHQVASRLIDVLRQPMYIDQHELALSASMGISIAPMHGDTFTALTQYADMALYQAKEKGKNQYCLFDDSMATRFLKRVEIEKELRKALEKGQLELYYQPIQDVQSGNLTGLEALIRWNHPEKGLISPGEFIPIAEESNLIIPIGDFVLRQAIQHIRYILPYKPDIHVAVNISLQQFTDHMFVEKIKSYLKEYDIPPSALTLEITESIAITQKEFVLKKLFELKSLGVRIALDDFGTGYSSLTYLKDLPIHILKIDRSFTMELPKNEQVSGIVQTIVDLGKKLKLSLIAEGVEEQQQKEFLAKIGCEEIQGYIYSPPQPFQIICEQYIVPVKTS
jgi:diguanylate cyclase (GGDEF)-like protein